MIMTERSVQHNVNTIDNIAISSLRYHINLISCPTPLFCTREKGSQGNCAHLPCPRGMYDVCTTLIISMRSVSKITVRVDIAIFKLKTICSFIVWTNGVTRLTEQQICPCLWSSWRLCDDRSLGQGMYPLA